MLVHVHVYFGFLLSQVDFFFQATSNNNRYMYVIMYISKTVTVDD